MQLVEMLNRMKSFDEKGYFVKTSHFIGGRFNP